MLNGRYEPPTCPYSKDRLDFAIHVRLGDRALGRGGEKGAVAIPEPYEGHLSQLMDTIAEEMASYQPLLPMFHIFTETEHPCPSGDNGTFPEFPNWPVEPDQVSQWCRFIPCVARVTILMFGVVTDSRPEMFVLITQNVCTNK